MAAAEPTACPVEECDSTVDYTALYDHLYNAHDASELCATVANLVADTEQLRAKVADAQDDSRKLNALEAYGVDNWDGYGDAMASLDDED